LANIVVPVHEFFFSLIGSLIVYGRETAMFNVYILLYVVHT